MGNFLVNAYTWWFRKDIEKAAQSMQDDPELKKLRENRDAAVNKVAETILNDEDNSNAFAKLLMESIEDCCKKRRDNLKREAKLMIFRKWFRAFKTELKGEHYGSKSTLPLKEWAKTFYEESNRA